MQPGKSPFLSRGRDRHRIVVLVLPDTMALEVTIAQQVFGRRIESFSALTGDVASPYEVVLCGEKTRHILPSGLDMGDLQPLEVLRDADTVLIPGLENPLTPRSDVLLSVLRDAAGAGARMVSFCAGAFVLGQAGLLEGKRATTHWVVAQEFRDLFPLVTLEPEQLFVEDGQVFTSGGMFSATDLSLHLLGLDLGYAYANDFSRMLVSAPVRAGGQAQYIKDSIRVDLDPPLRSLTDWIREHLGEPLTMADLADHEHMSERNLARRFNQTMGLSAFEWITKERINEAKVLVETTDLPIGQIAAMVGMGSAESLRRNFSRLVGTSAGSYRRTFQAEPVRVG
jgi:transcriptional regulator GlxA family with amidase domain